MIMLTPDIRRGFAYPKKKYKNKELWFHMYIVFSYILESLAKCCDCVSFYKLEAIIAILSRVSISIILPRTCTACNLWLALLQEHSSLLI